MREITSANLAQINADSLEEVWLVKLLFDDPLYANTNTIDITWDGNTYTGFGHLGSITQIRESELLTPDPLQFNLSGINTKLLMDALDATQYGATVTLYQGFITDGQLVDDPIEQWSGWAEFSAIQRGKANAITLTAQHDLADIEEADESRYSDEDQQARYPGDIGFEYLPRMGTLKLVWAGGAVDVGSPGRGARKRGLDIQ